MMNVKMNDAHGGSPERFGYSWHIFNDVLPIHREQFLRWSSALPMEAWRGAKFIDVGCGIGRNSLWAMRAGAVAGVAIDIDDRSLAAARRNLSEVAVEVRRESAYDIAEVSTFDIAFSIGVIHHLDNPVRALARMVRATKPGGYVLIWVYGRENNGWIIYVFDPLRRALFARLPLRLVYFLSLFPTAALWVALRCGLSAVEYCRLLRRFSFNHLRAVVFDQMIPRVANYWPRATVERLMAGAGLEDIRIVWVNEISWSAAGRRPLRQACPKMA
jgi:SAM-dependent methyltransferase